MSEIIEKISKIEKLYHGKGCSHQFIEDAQQELGIKFPKEYVDVVEKYGAISFYATEWTGVNEEDYLDVVTVTKQERSLNASIPSDCFVLENQGIEGLIVVANELGQVFSIQSSEVRKIYDTIEEYLDECIARKSNTMD